VSARLSVSPTNGAIPLTVSADASRSRPTAGSPITGYSFEFGDGSSVVGPQPVATAEHTYTAAGTYTVRVRVEDAAGEVSEDTKRVRAR
jgi:PKD repeat protein